MSNAATIRRAPDFGNFLGAAFGMTILLAIIFLVLQWLAVPVGRAVDWVVGIGGFWWLIVVVTVPWNIHFQAREVLAGAALSTERGITVNGERLSYARRWVPRSLALALALHFVSAAVFGLLAAWNISPIGYIGAGAALLLTALRPAVRAYEYVAGRLAAFAEELHVPREDAITLRADLGRLEGQIKELIAKLDSDDPRSWAATREREHAALRARADQLRIDLDTLRTSNEGDHQRLAREAQQAIARLSADAQFLEHVREIIRFVKDA